MTLQDWETLIKDNGYIYIWEGKICHIAARNTYVVGFNGEILLDGAMGKTPIGECFTNELDCVNYGIGKEDYEKHTSNR
jgi:hypothetical protein